MEQPLNREKIIRGWAFFDWANSAFALVISVAIFPAYFINHSPDFVSVLGAEISNSALFSYTISFTYLLLVILLPFLSGLADYSGKRMTFLKIFTLVGSIGCMLLFFFNGVDRLFWGLWCFVLAMIGFDGGKVFYNSYLPLICSRDRYDKVSAMGFAYGYIGSVILLIFNLVMILYPSWFGIDDPNLAIRISFITVGLWWIGFAQIPFARLPKEKESWSSSAWKKGLSELYQAYQMIVDRKNLLRFLYSFFFYSAGVQTVLYLASTFAEKELQFGTTGLIVVILILQLLAIGGAYLFSAVSQKRGNKAAIVIMLIIWIVICAMAYFVHDKGQFYVLAALVGLVMGGIQSTSRSTFAKLLPKADTHHDNSYFGFYEILEKLAIVFGTFSFGLIDQLSGGMRNSILILALYFVIGLILLFRVRGDELKFSVNQ